MSGYLKAWRVRQKLHKRCVWCREAAEPNRSMCAIHLYKARLNQARRKGRPLPEWTT